MTVEVLTYERAVELAREVVAEFGADYVYPMEHKRQECEGSTPSCVYVHKGCPSCLVGQILHRHGVSLEDLSLWEFRSAWETSDAVANTELSARDFLWEIQSVQDSGRCWGEAVEVGVAHIKAVYG